MHARFYIDSLEQALARTGITAKVMFGQDDGRVHLWGDGWEFRFIPGSPPLDIERFGLPPTDDDFRTHVIPLLQAWSEHAGVFTPDEDARLREYKDSLKDH
jgi:hypothetical protein